MAVGTEHEYSINDSLFNPLPISDKLIEQISGHITSEISFGDTLLSKELQKHAIELIPQKPHDSLDSLEASLYEGIKRLYRSFGKDYRFMGLGMHPLLTLDKTTYWDHEESEYYRIYDRLFNIKQHGWLNIQALQINFPYGSKEKLTAVFNKVRALIPYLIAVSAASPFVEGSCNGTADNRLLFYRDNQKEIPLICHGILPERLNLPRDYVQINRKIYRELKERDADILCREWVNSRGVIVRFTRGCLEVKAIDEQECIRSDMALTAFLMALLRSDLALEEDEPALRSLMEDAILNGTDNLKTELRYLYKKACHGAHRDELKYLPFVEARIERGSLAEVLQQRYKEAGDIRPLLEELEESLRNNVPYIR